MVYTQKNIKNGLQSLLVGNITNSDTLLTITTGEGGMFPSNNTPLVLEQFNTSGVCFKREVINLVSKSGDILTVSRAYEESVQDDTAAIKTITQNALSFNLEQGIVKISQYMTAKIFDDLENEVVAIRTELGDDILEAVQNQNVVYGASSTGNDSYVITLSPAPTSLSDLKGSIYFLSDVGNTGTATLNINGLGAKTIKKLHDQDLIDGDIEASQKVEVVYNTTTDVFEMVSQVAKVVDITVNNTKSPIILGETVSAGDYLRLGSINLAGNSPVNIAGNFNSTSQNRIGYDNTEFKQSQPFTLANSGQLNGNINLELWKTGSPTGSLTLKIYSDQGITLIATSSNTISESSLSSSGASPTIAGFIFPGLTLNSGTYYMTIECNRANNTSNYSVWRLQTGSNTGYYVSSTNVYTITTQRAYSLEFAAYIENTGKFYKASASNILKTKYRGYAESSGVLDGVINMITGPIDNFRTGLTSGVAMYLSDTAGGISSTPGTNPVEIGKAISTTSIEMNIGEKEKITLTATRTSQSATGITTYTHGLGRVPNFIEVEAFAGMAVGIVSKGSWYGNKNQCIISRQTTNDAETSGTNSIRMLNSSNLGQVGVIQNITATTFDVSWIYLATAPALYTFAIFFTIS